MNRVQGGALPVQGGASPVQGDAPPVQDGALPVQSGALPVQGDAPSVQGGAPPVKGGGEEEEKQPEPEEKQPEPEKLEEMLDPYTYYDTEYGVMLIKENSLPDLLRYGGKLTASDNHGILNFDSLYGWFRSNIDKYVVLSYLRYDEKKGSKEEWSWKYLHTVLDATEKAGLAPPTALLITTTRPSGSKTKKSKQKGVDKATLLYSFIKKYNLFDKVQIIRFLDDNQILVEDFGKKMKELFQKDTPKLELLTTCGKEKIVPPKLVDV